MNWSYIAGFFDGEGCIAYTDKHWNICITITQREPEVLNEISKFLTAQGVKHRRKDRTQHKRPDRPISKLFISTMDSTCMFLSHTYPELIVKKTKAREALDIVHRQILKRDGFQSRIQKAVEFYQNSKVKPSVLSVANKYGLHWRSLRDRL